MKYLSAFRMWFHMIFNSLKEVMGKTIEPTIHVLEFVKSALASPAVDVIASISGKAWPEEVKAFLLKALPEAITVLKIADVKPHLSDPNDPKSAMIQPTAADYVKALLDGLKGLDENQRAMIMHKIASTMVRIAHSDMTMSEADTLVQMAYNKLKTDGTLNK